MEESQEIKALSEILFNNLPFWKKWTIKKWYKRNGWDVSHEWENCVKVAEKMVWERDKWIK